MLQHDSTRPHIARICTQFLEAENIPVLAWPADSPDMSPIEHVWEALERRIRQDVPVPSNIQQLRMAIEEERTNIPQATIVNLINSLHEDELNCMRQMVARFIMDEYCVNIHAV
uniref:Transposase n=1 Tax=Denticeps clupeoides TaxID=299321 RepID=A0AAY4BJK9_9TELE